MLKKRGHPVFTTCSKLVVREYSGVLLNWLAPLNNHFVGGNIHCTRLHESTSVLERQPLVLEFKSF